MKLNKYQAAKAAGISRTTLDRHIKDGKISVGKDGTGKTVIDVAELERVYNEVDTDSTSQNVAGEQSETSNDNKAVHLELEILREYLDRMESDRDRERRQLENVIDERGDHHRAQAEADEQRGRKGRDEAEQGETDGEGGRDLCLGPAEFQLQGDEHHADRAHGAGRDEGGEEGHEGDDPGIVDAEAREETDDRVGRTGGGEASHVLAFCGLFGRA